METIFQFRMWQCSHIGRKVILFVTETQREQRRFKIKGASRRWGPFGMFYTDPSRSPGQQKGHGCKSKKKNSLVHRLHHGGSLKLVTVQQQQQQDRSQ